MSDLLPYRGLRTAPGAAGPSSPPGRQPLAGLTVADAVPARLLPEAYRGGERRPALRSGQPPFVGPYPAPREGLQPTSVFVFPHRRRRPRAFLAAPMITVVAGPASRPACRRPLPGWPRGPSRLRPPPGRQGVGPVPSGRTLGHQRGRPGRLRRAPGPAGDAGTLHTGLPPPDCKRLRDLITCRLPVCGRPACTARGRGSARSLSRGSRRTRRASRRLRIPIAQRGAPRELSLDEWAWDR